MKLDGQKIEGPNKMTIVIPRGDRAPIVFQAQAIMDYSELDNLLPRPKAGTKIIKGGKRVVDTEAPTYVQAMKDYGTRRFSYIVLKSLQATPDLEWEKVDFGRPATWPLFEDELKESGFTPGEIHAIITKCLEVNALDEEKINQARQDFLASQETTQEESSSLDSEPSSTPSGEPANVS